MNDQERAEKLRRIAQRFIDGEILQEIRLHVLDEICLNDAGWRYMLDGTIYEPGIPVYHLMLASKRLAQNLVDFYESDQSTTEDFTINELYSVGDGIIHEQHMVWYELLLEIPMRNAVQASGVRYLSFPYSQPVEQTRRRLKRIRPGVYTGCKIFDGYIRWLMIRARTR